jgi:transcription-repair coupling factor (superfamily II helicase)
MTVGDARKRIHAIKQYTALGSGFKIAMRDLEIRGAGNLLGTRQSGQISQIGFELYCQLLRQSVERLKGRKDAPHGEATFKADFIIPTEFAWKTRVPPVREDGRPAGPDSHPVPAFLPASWLEETRIRIAAYRELAEAGTEKAVAALEQSWRDRFGRLPDAAANLLHIARIKALAAAQNIASVEISGQRLMLHRNGDYIMLDGRRFPRLKAASPATKLAETIAMLRLI